MNKTPKKKKKKKGTRVSKKKMEETVQKILEATVPKPEYVKHLVRCRCHLPQYRAMEEPPSHMFPVFNELDEKGDVKPSYAQCNNCGIVHRVTEVGESTTIGKEEMRSLITIDDIKLSLPEWLVGILEQYDVDLPTWQEAEYIIRREIWGRMVILAKERMDDAVVGKYLVILGRELYKIESFERDDSWIEVGGG